MDQAEVLTLVGKILDAMVDAVAEKVLARVNEQMKFLDGASPELVRALAEDQQFHRLVRDIVNNEFEPDSLTYGQEEEVKELIRNARIVSD